MQNSIFNSFGKIAIWHELDKKIAQNLAYNQPFELFVYLTCVLFGNISYLMILMNKYYIIALLKNIILLLFTSTVRRDHISICY